jgi:hypothetical protein
MRVANETSIGPFPTVLVPLAGPLKLPVARRAAITDQAKELDPSRRARIAIVRGSAKSGQIIDPLIQAGCRAFVIRLQRIRVPRQVAFPSLSMFPTRRSQLLSLMYPAISPNAFSM